MNEMIAVNGQNNPVICGSGFEHSLFQRFIDYTDVKESTLKGYVTDLKQFFIWLKDNNISNPDRESIKAYKAHLESRGFTAGTQAQYLRAVKQFFKWASSESLYPNVADNIKGAKVKQDNTKKEAFLESDMLKILNSIDLNTEEGLRDFVMLLLSVTGALRIIEMQRANVGDIQTIKGQKVIYIQGKGRDEKDEYIKIVPALDQAITDYLTMRGNVKKTDPLFTGIGNRAKGKRLTEPSISRIIKARFVNAGYDCKKLTAHSLRHTSNTLLFKSGADLYTVQRHARHADPKTTEIYIHMMERETDTSEQTIYDRIFNPDKAGRVKECCSLIQSMNPDQQEEAYKALLQILNRDGLQVAI